MGIKKTLTTIILTGILALGLTGKADAGLRWCSGSSTMGIGGATSSITYSPDALEGLDPLDRELQTDYSYNNQFVSSFSSIEGKRLQYDFRPNTNQGGKNYNFSLIAFRDDGKNITGNNYLQFDRMDSSAGITDFKYDINVWGNNPSSVYYSESGLVSDLMIPSSSGLTGVWNVSNIPSGQTYGSLSITAIPEPATIGLLGLGSLALLKRKK